MTKVPSIVEKRLKTEIPKFQKILKHAQQRDINEADTVAIISDMLERVFGFDKYEDVTREFAIKNTYVDLAIKTGKEIDYLIEAKSIGTTLKELHLKQAIDYAANKGVQWTILTNGINWQIHRVTVDGKVTNEKIFEFNFLEISNRNSDHLNTLFMLCKKAISKGLINEFYEQAQCFNKYVIGTILQTEAIAKPIRTLLRKLNPGLKVDIHDIQEMISNDVLKRELVESDNNDGQALIKKTKSKLTKLFKK
ncbi:hypothetical protein MNBD_GAMMA03-927 [hydrothermal vent metagenome]|uniref:Uncharacterized protein n=1 Tax=hydrothermal vent metagenome TaxID=652676 RepID=A0A3B0WEA3_9ZZZZ